MHKVDQWKASAQKVLDVRPQIARGEKPFTTIMEATSALTANQTVVVIAPFEPVPLYGAMKLRSFTHETEQVNVEEWVVRFSKQA